MAKTKRKLSFAAPFPSVATLRKYGLSDSDYAAILERQDGVCAVCGLMPSSGRLCIDHEHVKGWRKMPAEDRKRYVRGLLCWFCNKNYVGRAITIERSKRVTAYLEAYLTKQVDWDSIGVKCKEQELRPKPEYYGYGLWDYGLSKL